MPEIWKEKLKEAVCFQIKAFFGFTDTCTENEQVFVDTVYKAADDALLCIEKYSFRPMPEGGWIIDPLHQVNYCIFLYWLSRRLYLAGNIEAASKVFYLNKLLNGVEIFYEVELPKIWACAHPLGSVIGRARYGDWLYFYQGCTVGANFCKDGSVVYPEIGSHVKMMTGSQIIGSCHIGNNVIVSANTCIMDQDVPDGVIVFGHSPKLIFKENKYMNGCEVDNILSK